MDAKLAAQIGQALQRARKSQKLSQAEVAERLDKSPEFYGRLERGGTLPSIETLADLVRVLGVGADVLLGNAGAPPAAKVPREELTAKERLVLRRLRRATPRALRLVTLLLGELEKVAGTARRKRQPPRKRG